MATDYDRRHAFAAFVWALGVRGEVSLTPNYSMFDINFTHAWRKWRRSDDVAWWEGMPDFDTHNYRFRPQSILRGADRWQVDSPLDDEGRIRLTAGWNADEELAFLCEHQPHLGQPRQWLALADIYLARLATEGLTHVV